MFTLLIILVSLQVVLRTFNIPITATWTEPIARYLFIVGTYFGAAVASRNNEHVRLTLVRQKVLAGRKRAQSVLDIVTVLSVLVFVVVAIWTLYLATIHGWDTKALGGVTTLTAGHIYLGILLGFGLMAVFEIQNLLAALENLLGRDITARFTRGGK
ncbi:TRAP transporter small permease [Halorarum salinum]|uniref:TRAP transporter small permease n=2 Tax=Halorarum salinum TaxID=2743089 RepID=A0A7D5QEZ9_9EURY|nr:TRAP transporter small permease [Halobaculum salinum]